MSARDTDYYKTNTLYKLEGYFKIGFILSTLVYLPFPKFNTFQLFLAIAASILGIRRQFGPVQFNKEYAISVLTSDFGSSILFILLLFFVELPSMVFFLALDLFYIIGAAEFINRAQVGILTRIPKVKEITQAIIGQKEQIKRARVYVEFFLFFYMIVLVFMRKLNLLPILIMFNYLKIRGTGGVPKEVYGKLRTDFETKLGFIPGLGKGLGWFLSILGG